MNKIYKRILMGFGLFILLLCLVACGKNTGDDKKTDDEQKDNPVVVETKVKVTFDIGGVTDTIEIKKGELITFPDEPTKEGYTFNGWKNNNSFFSVDTPVTEDLYLVATFIVNSYTLTVDYDNGQTDTFTLKYGEQISLKNPTKTGYTFSKWDKELVTMPASDTTIKALYTINTYNVTIKYNDGFTEDKVLKVEYLGKVNIETPVREDYTFDGWDKEIPESITEDITLEAKWAAIKYHLLVKNYYGPGENYASNIGGKEKIELVTPTRDYYVFKEYNEKEDGTGEKINLDTMPSHNLTVYVIWTCEDFTISYDLDGGEATNATSYNIEQEVTLNNPTKTGYTFIGWTGTGLTEATMTVKISKGSNGVRSYKANYKAIDYTISYDLDGGEATNVTTYNILEEVTLVNPTKSGYTFTGWTGSDLTEATMIVKINKGNIGDKSYKATYKTIDYTISYDLDGGEATNKVSYNILEEVTLVNPTKVGYTFTGWTGTDLTEATMTVKINKGNIGDRSYKANYTANEYTITYDAQGGTISQTTQKVVYDSNYSLETPSKDAYTFTGWYLNDKQFNEGIWNNVSSIVLVAKWQTIDYTITYDLDGGEATNVTTYNILEEVTLVNPTKTGYTFAGWTGTGLTEASMSVTISKGNSGERSYKATYTPIQYLISYDLDGGDAENENDYTIEEEVKLINPTKTGYTFIGWTGTGLTEATMNVTINKGSTGDRSYKANYTFASYTITFDTDGGSTINSITQEYGSAITKPNNPTKENYIFAGWDIEIPDTMPANNLTIKALWLNKSELTIYKEGDFNYIDFGKFPQTHINDDTLINNLNALTTTNANGYYEYEGCEYAKITATPASNSFNYSDGTSVVAVATWFKVEPIKWRVLQTNNNEYTLLSEYLLIAKRFDDDSNDYATSEMRNYLIGDFISKAFTTMQQTIIQSNSNVNGDKVWLLDQSELCNTNYGFNSLKYEDDTNRLSKPTDYALATGALLSKGCGTWWNRTASYTSEDYESFVNYFGTANSAQKVTTTEACVRPSIYITIEN